MEELLKAIQPHEIEWRVQNQTKDGQKIIIVPYITNRCVMDRFDSAFGWDRWNSKFDPIDGGFICTLTVITLKGGTISKSDGANKTNIEPIKGGISDSMKRAAVHFGLGRCLYNYPKVMIETTNKYIPNWAFDRLNGMVVAINDGTFKDKMVILKDK